MLLHLIQICVFPFSVRKCPPVLKIANNLDLKLLAFFSIQKHSWPHTPSAMRFAKSLDTGVYEETSGFLRKCALCLWTSMERQSLTARSRTSSAATEVIGMAPGQNMLPSPGPVKPRFEFKTLCSIFRLEYSRVTRWCKFHASRWCTAGSLTCRCGRPATGLL